jgi:hypothetical protein
MWNENFGSVGRVFAIKFDRFLTTFFSSAGLEAQVQESSKDLYWFWTNADLDINAKL